MKTKKHNNILVIVFLATYIISRIVSYILARNDYIIVSICIDIIGFVLMIAISIWELWIYVHNKKDQ